MKIAFFDTKGYDKKPFEEANKNGDHEIKFFNNNLTEDTAILAKGYDAVCAFVNDEGNEKIMKKLHEVGIKFWFQRSAGYDRIDLKAALKYNIKIFRVPGYSPEAVAEFAWGLIMSVNRNIHIASQRTSVKNFSLEGLEGSTLFGKTMGVLGAGRIGQAFIKIAVGFGMRVIVFDDFAKKNFPKTALDLGFNYVSKDEIFREADFISLHCPLNNETKHIVNEESISKMKKEAIIVNTARGGLINTKDLLEALDYAKIRGAGIDVYENEGGITFNDLSNELVPDLLLTRLRSHRNVLLTSHQAWFTTLSLQQIAKTTMNNINAAENNDFKKSLQLQNDGKIING